MFRIWIYWRALQIFFDLIFVYGAFLLAYFVRVGWIFSTDFPFPLFAGLSALGALVWVVFLLFTKNYRLPPRPEGKFWYEIVLIFVGGVIAVGILIVSYFFPREVLFSRWIGVYIWGFGSAWLILSNFIFRLIIRRRGRSKNVYKTLIVGANRITEKLIGAIEKDIFAPYKVVGAIDPYGLYKKDDLRIFGKLDKLESSVEKEGITAIIQTDAFEHTLNLISLCEEKDIKFQMLPSLRGIFEENIRLRSIAGHTMISFVQRNYSGARKKQFRIVDWVLHTVFDVD